MLLKINEAAAKVLGFNTTEGFCSLSYKLLKLWVFLASATVLTPCRLEFWGQPKVLGVNTLASTKLVGVRSEKCWVLWTTIMEACGGVRFI